MRVLAWLLLVVLAGCTSPAPEPTQTTTPGPDDATTVPVWSVGDYWTLQFDAAFKGTASLVVTGTDGAYQVETNDPALALFDARNDISWLGPQRIHDLAGHQRGQAVEYLRFPLLDGARWSTTWDGKEREVLARKVADGRFDLTATEGDGHVAVQYQYDAAKRWVTAWKFLDRDGGERTVTLTGSGTGFTGTIHRYLLGEPIRAEVPGTGGVEYEFTIDSQVTEIGLLGHVDCGGSGQVYAALRAPVDGQQSPLPLLPVVGGADWEADYACPGGGDNPVDETLPGIAGPWRFRGLSASEGASIILDIEPRTLISTPFPS